MGDPTTDSPATAPMDRRAVALLSLSHLFIDLCQGVVPAMLPFLIAAGEITYAAGGGLVFAISAASSVVQPLFGLLADRVSLGWLLPASVAVTGLTLAAGLQSPSYWLMVLLLGVSGLGVAAYHPEAARQTRRVSGGRAATGMSVFAFGGGLGFALAPTVTAALFVALGSHGLLVAAPAALALTAILSGWLPRRPVAGAGSASAACAGRENWRAFGVVSLITVARSVVFVGLNTFLALYWMAHYGASAEGGAKVLGLFLGSGLVGTLLGGWVGDRVDRRLAVRCGFLGAAAVLPLLLTDLPAEWKAAALVPLAVTFSVPWSSLVILGQEYLPNRLGVASGVTLGLAVSFGGMSAPLLGWVADAHGLPAVLTALEVVLATAAALGLLLPRPVHVPIHEPGA